MKKQKQKKTHLYTGTHLLCEFWGCPAKTLDSKNFIMRALRDATKESQASLVGVWAYKFAPQGVTGVALLKESHITVHTWPEWGYAAVDLFMCGAKADSRKGAQFLSQCFGAKESVVTEIKRGLKNGTR